MPYCFCTLVPPPSGTLPPLVMAWPPISPSASTTMTEHPASRATIAAGIPVAPDPMTTISASRSHSRGMGGNCAAFGTRFTWIPLQAPAEAYASFRGGNKPCGGLLRSGLAHDRFDLGEELVGAEGFLQDRVGAEQTSHFQGVGVAGAAAAGNRDDLGVGVGAAQGQDGLDAFLARHVDIGDDEVEFLPVVQLQAANAVLRGNDLIPVLQEHAGDRSPDQGVVVDQQDLHRHT